MNSPSGVFGEVIRNDRCAANRLSTGAANRTVSGIATPTTSPVPGAIDVTAGGVLIAAEPVATEPVIAIATEPAITSTDRVNMRSMWPV
ncbi:hypothetical protein MMON_18000 [Mycolicibacterium monacense]|uniref:Uncharacterized protein n=1 Tax=Mycolicibacterium monacense TaxID=85693 RepID=A0AAD1ITC1_MYCMB|nr:hypothetical protein MMON_18000 [Mycolicibacterium monacense]